MGVFSRYCLTIFEILNEIYAAVGSGIFGLAMIIDKRFETNNILRTMAIACGTGTCIYYLCRSTERKQPTRSDVVLITGCDSGLGFSLAQHTADLGFTVIATFVSLESKGAKELKDLYGNAILQLNLDLTDFDNIRQVAKYVEVYVSANNLRLHSFINNSAIMVFGEFEWLTESQIISQLSVNLIGTLVLSKALCPTIRKHRGRLITVTSHCAQACLPGLSVYGASKAALAAWSDGLRVELGKYGVKVITFVPGSFTNQSNIMANQKKYAVEMHHEFSKEQRRFYDPYFKSYNTYLSFIPSPSEPRRINDYKMYSIFEEALLDNSPKSNYTNENCRYAFYHFLFRISPTCLRDYFVTKFMQMPEYNKQKVAAIA